MKKNILFIITLCVISACRKADSDYHALRGSSNEEVIQSEQISNRFVYGISQDKNGVIWLGTFRGLNCFDGSQFMQYFSVDDNKGLWDNHITDIFRDSRDRLWITTVNGACIYRDDDSFQRVEMSDINRNLSRIFESPDGRIFMYSSTDLFCYDEESNSLKDAVVGNDFPIFSTWYAASDNTLWALNGNVIKGYESGRFSLLGDYEAPGWIKSSSFNSASGLWFTTDSGLWLFNPLSRKTDCILAASSVKESFSFEKVYRIFAIGSSHILMCTSDSRIWLYYVKENRLLSQDDKSFPFSIPYLGNISCIFRDSSHNIWLGTEDDGFYVAARNKDIFSSYPKLQKCLAGQQVTSLVTNREGSVLIAATRKSGVFIYNLLDDSVQNFSSLNPSHLFRDSRGDIWFLYPRETKLERYGISSSSLRLKDRFNSGLLMSACEDSNGDIWFGGLGEDAYKYNHESNSLSKESVYTDNAFTFIPGISTLNDSTLIVSGFYRNPRVLNTNDGSSTELSLSGDDLKRCIRRSVLVPTALFKDNDGRIWFGTVANGLMCYDLGSNRLSAIDGAPCVDISSIEQDNDGYLWVGTMHGLGRLNTDSGEFTNFFFDGEASASQFYDRSSCKLPDGTLIFGGTHGITVVNPKAKADSLSLPFIFESIKTNNRLLRPSADGALTLNLSEKPKLTLQHDQNSFSIRYSILDYTSSGRSHYYYKLEGFDKEWHDAESGNEAFYTNVHPGFFTFKVRYVDDTHTVNSVEDSFAIVVRAAPWASWWALLLYICVIASIVFVFWYMHRKSRRQSEENKRLQYEKEQEQKLNKMHMSFVANVAHEFRTPLTTIKGPLSILSESLDLSTTQHKLITVMQKSTDRMMGLVSQFLDFNRLENDTLKLEVSRHNISEELRRYAEVFETTASLKKINFLTEGLDYDFEMYFDSDKLYKMVSNLFSNAMKYTPQGGTIKLCFDVSADGSQVHISMVDNGIGVAEEYREKIFEKYYRISEKNIWGSGIGLYYVRALAHSHHGSIVCMANEEEQKGSVFVLTLPTVESAYSADEFAKELSQSEKYPIQEGRNAEEDEKEEENKTKILVVDDDVDICNYLKILLRAEGYVVMYCYDADTALAKIKEWEPDMVLCDVNMPVKDGYQLCREVRKDISLSHLPIILVTAKTSLADQVMGLDSGADAYITKPFEPKYLFAMISSQLERRQNLQQTLSTSTDANTIQEEETLSLQDKAFLERLYEVMENSIANLELDINDFAQQLHISRTKLYYKVKGLTGESPAAFFKTYKLNKSAQMICEGKYNLSEISDRTGFASLSHFSTSFKKQFGMTPSEYAKNRK